MASIYTRTGDDGTTGLIGGQRVPKDSLYTEAVGALDELNAQLGVVRSFSLPDGVDSTLEILQDRLFVIGAVVASPEGTSNSGPKIDDQDIRRLEAEIDAYEADLPPLRQLILPGGSTAGAQLHLARAIARRAERRCVALSRTAKVAPEILRYLNRLSDLCFVLARHVNRQQSAAERHPTFKRS